MKYYAVRKGYKTGIFVDWEECKSYVCGFSGASQDVPYAEYRISLSYYTFFKKFGGLFEYIVAQ